MLRYLPAVLSLALTIYCLVDAVQTDESVMRNLPKIPWIILIVLFPVIGPVAWLLAGRPGRDAYRGRSQQQRWEDHRRDQERREQERRRPRGPDDDPDFLKGL